jgi:CheY-like chemotaxis protein
MSLAECYGCRFMPEEVAVRSPLVLLVDDDHAVRGVSRHYCERGGFRVVQAADAPDAMEKALLLSPEVILLDLILPSMPGWELAKQLRGDERTSHIPILATSGMGADEAERKARAAGVDDFIAKPFDGLMLVQQLRKLVPDC